MKILLFYFVIVNHHYDAHPWRESVGYISYAACVEGQMDYRTNDEPGVFSECYGKEAVTRD